jgi:hypothetical protein
MIEPTTVQNPSQKPGSLPVSTVPITPSRAPASKMETAPRVDSEPSQRNAGGRRLLS